MKEAWAFEELVEKLSKEKVLGHIHQFQAQKVNLQRREYYLVGQVDGRVSASRDQVRSIDQNEILAHVHVAKPNNRLGSAHKLLYTNQDLSVQLDALKKMAQISDEEWWDAPSPALTKIDQDPVPTFVASQKEDLAGFSDHLIADYEAALATLEDGIFNSAEVTSGLQGISTVSGNGFEYHRESSRFYSEVCFSQADKSKGQSDEFLVTEWFGHPDQIDFAQMCKASIIGAQSLLEARLPESGTYSVLISAEVLREIFDTVLWQLDGHQQYLQMPSKKEGEPLIKDYKGMPYSLILDPLIPYGLPSVGYTSLGFANQSLTLAEDNQIINNLRTARVAQYLKKSETTTQGSVRVECRGGGVPYNDLIRSADRVLEIHQFSGLFCNPMDLTFSSEIRLARLYDNKTGQSRWIKGGNLSGNFTENFREVQWSKEKGISYSYDDKHSKGYVGPGYALISNVTISA